MIAKNINYIAKQGDTLFSIAKMFNTSINNIINENKLINPSLTYPGMTITVPLKGITYTVAPGENVYGIANKFGVPYEAIVYANDLVYPYSIYPNVSIYIPGVNDNKNSDTLNYQDPSMPCWSYPCPPPPTCPPMPPTCPPQPEPGPCPPMPPTCPPQPEPCPCPPMPPTCPPQPEPCPPNKEPMDHFIYTVKSGDTLYKLSMLFCTTIEAIACANHIADPNKIYAGQKLRIPVSCGGLIHYTVKSGDSLYKIAKRFNTTVDSIANANAITDPSSIFPGQKLIIIADCKPDP